MSSLNLSFREKNESLVTATWLTYDRKNETSKKIATDIRNHLGYFLCFLFSREKFHRAVEEDNLLGSLVLDGMMEDKDTLTVNGACVGSAKMSHPKETILLV